MSLIQQSPRKSLNKSYLKVKPNRSDIEKFKTNLTQLLDQMNDKETEEFHKTLLTKFLDGTYYSHNHFVNTKGRNDLVIHNGKDASSTVGVIIETKSPTNKNEMLSHKNLNTKALQELVWYYLQERIIHNNLEVKHLITTNINEWFIFDAQVFEKAFAQDNALVKQFNEFKEGRLSGKDTSFFYKNIAEPAIAKLISAESKAGKEISYTHFDLRDVEKIIRNADKSDDIKLIALFKLLSPEHLLKLPFKNDSNSLDKGFYAELLHIIGLTEVKDGGKKLIDRKEEGARNDGSILENTIHQLDVLDKLSRVDRPSQFGSTNSEKFFNLGLELVITWINRILFLKLLEAQLKSYHKGNKDYSFLNNQKIKNFDDLNSLFFSVLAKQTADRSGQVKATFQNVPYLNSSLFEPTDLEHSCLFISQLLDDKQIPILSSTVLKDSNGKKRTGNLSALQYLFEFLDSYDFSSEGSEDIQEENKTLISASVLGLIFEKINGYKDGSFFTPGFITMYMCRETIRRAILQKFKEVKGWDCETLDQLYDKITDKKEANTIINSLKICDPAVGSGHFLVSALNEIIAIKSELKILIDQEGKTLRDFTIEVINDELAITDDDGKLFEYNPWSSESQRVQETLFHEKQTIIENCLFGVDINPNSVKICRLRLWIELLKNAYYRTETNFTELETLPNIDINIKCGNSIISRYSLDVDLSQTLKRSKISIAEYKASVQKYRNAENKEQKREMEQLINSIKSNFRSEISQNDPKVKKLSIKRGELNNLLNQHSLFELSKSEKKSQEKIKTGLKKEIEELELEIDQIKSNKIYENSFEWRFEFPEVLDDEGNFMGFDIIIGNPPYVRQEKISWMKPLLQHKFSTYTGMADLYIFFVEHGIRLVKKNYFFCYILPNKWMKGGYGVNLRKFSNKIKTLQIVDFGDLPVFDEAITYPCIWLVQNTEVSSPKFDAVHIDTLDFPNGISNYIYPRLFKVAGSSLTEDSWNLVDYTNQALLEKIKSQNKPLSEYIKDNIFRGVLTGKNEAFVIDSAKKEELIAADPKCADIIKPFLAGKDINRYLYPSTEKFLIFTKRGIQIENYPSIYAHLLKYRELLEPKPKDWKGKKWEGRKEGTYKWFEIQDSIDYFLEFEKPKILYQEIAAYSTFAFDEKGIYPNNKLFFIPSSNKALLGFLNSKLVWYFLNKTCSILRGALALQSPNILSIPFSEKLKNHPQLEELVTKRLAQTDKYEEYENTIDRIVYQIYGLTDDEISIVESI